MHLVSSLVRGRTLRAIDEVFAEADLDEVLAQMKSGNLRGLAAFHGFAESSGEEAHIEDAVGGGWWPKCPAKEEILMSAYIKAVERAKERAVRTPISTIWVRGMAGRFEASVLELDHEILVVWMTPDPPGEPMPPEADEQREIRDDGIWAIAEASRIDGYAKAFKDRGYAPEDRVTSYADEGLGAAKVFHLIAY